MVQDKIYISKKNTGLFNDETEKRKVSRKVNALLPKLLEEIRNETNSIDFPDKITFTTKSIPYKIKKDMITKKETTNQSYSKIILNMLVELDNLKLKSAEKRILEKIEQATEIQVRYYRETIYQINEFLRTLED